MEVGIAPLYYTKQLDICNISILSVQLHYSTLPPCSYTAHDKTWQS